MKTLLIKTMLLAALVFGSLLAVYLLPLPHKDYLSAILDKRDLLTDESRNRIIFVGGSGLYCGLDTELVQQRLKRPVINMGLYYGLGITPLLAEIKPFLRPGDLVLIIPEYAMDFDHYDDHARKWIYALAPAKNFIPVYRNTRNPVKTYIQDMNGLLHSKLDAMPLLARNVFRSGRLTPFLKHGYISYQTDFTPGGDSLKGFPAAPILKGKGSKPEYKDQSMSGINAFCREARKSGVDTFFMFPAHGVEDSRRYLSEMRRHERMLRKELDCEILGSIQDFVYPYRFFTNSVNHLNNEGKRMRTEKVIRLLEKAATASRGGAAGEHDRISASPKRSLHPE